MEAYKHCFYNNNNKTIYLRTVEDKHYRKITYNKDYYVKDPTEQSPIKDIYGVPVVRRTHYDRSAVDQLKKARNCSL